MERRNHMETSYTASSASPAVQLPTNRSLLKFVLLSIITLGIYGHDQDQHRDQHHCRPL